MQELPKGSFFVIRTNILREFEQKIANESDITIANNLPETPESAGRREQQIEMILAVIAALNFVPMQIPDGGKAKIKAACLTRPRFFTESGFDHAWKEGLSAGHFRLVNHVKYSPNK